MSEITETFDVVIREHIDFVNSQVGMYMDALAGFEGHHTRIEQQVARVLRPERRQINPQTRTEVVVWASYEDVTLAACRT